MIPLLMSFLYISEPLWHLLLNDIACKRYKVMGAGHEVEERRKKVTHLRLTGKRLPTKAESSSAIRACSDRRPLFLKAAKEIERAR